MARTQLMPKTLTRLSRRFALSVLMSTLFVSAPVSQLHAAPFAYVAGSGFGTVSVIDVETNTVVATISLPTGSLPTHVAVAPDGTRVYVTSGSFPGTVFVIDTSTNKVLAPAIVVGNGPSGIAVGPDGRLAYVANQFGSSVSVIDTTSNTVVATIQAGVQPTAVGLTPDGSRVYVADSVFGAVWVIDAATNTTVGNPIFVGGNPQDLVMNPDGSKMYVSNFNSQSVSVIDTVSNMVLTTIAVGFFPLGMDTSPDGTRLYVVDNDPALNNGSVAVIDATTNALLTRVSLPAFHASRRVAITPGGARGYVTINSPQRVLAFDTATNIVVGDEIVIDGIPEGIAITPERTGVIIPFAVLKSKLNVRPNSRHIFTLKGTFVLGDASDGIQPQSESVRLSISDANGVVFEADLPAGSFKRIAKRGAIFHSARKGSAIRLMRISAKSMHNVYSFQVLASTTDFNRSNMPSVTLSVARHNYVHRNSLTFAQLLARLQAMREAFRTVAASGPPCPRVATSCDPQKLCTRQLPAFLSGRLLELPVGVGLERLRGYNGSALPWKRSSDKSQSSRSCVAAELASNIAVDDALPRSRACPALAIGWTRPRAVCRSAPSARRLSRTLVTGQFGTGLRRIELLRSTGGPRPVGTNVGTNERASKT
jgi:YVTN family beta-propeller protein